MFSNIFEGLVFFLSNMFLPSYASSIGLSRSTGAIIISVTNVATIFGQVSMGYLADRFDGQLLMFISSFLSRIGVLCVWGFSKTFATLLVFCIAYGIFAGGYSVLYCRFAAALTSDDGTQVWLYSTIEAQRGVVIILGGLLSGTLTSGVTGFGEYGIGSYERLILVVGILMLLSSLVVSAAFSEARFSILLSCSEVGKLLLLGEKNLGKASSLIGDTSWGERDGRILVLDALPGHIAFSILYFIVSTLFSSRKAVNEYIILF